jgi:hypothetical protein
MIRPRLSLVGLLRAIFALGLGLAALRFASSFWYLAMTLASLAALLAAILGVIFLRGRERAYWAGFALFG